MQKIIMFIKIILLGLMASVLLSPLTGCANNNAPEESASPQEDIPDTSDIPEEAAIEPEPEIIKAVEPRFKQYILKEEELVEPEEFKGNMWIVVGKNGYLYENGYINEYLGSAPKYINVTDEQLNQRTDILKNIQDEFEKRGVAFCVAITPSKASTHPQFIPDFHIAEYPPLIDTNTYGDTDGYVRPYIRFKNLLEAKGIYFVDSQTVYQSIGMTNIFPKTGIHWNLMAAYETSNAIVDEYERQRGFEVRRLIADSIQSSSTPYSVEQDIFGAIYKTKEGRPHIDNAIVDEKYYAHDVYLEPSSTKPKIGKMLIQGGSFTGDFTRFFGNHQLAEKVSSIYYNNGDKADRVNWEKELKDIDFVLLEVNEQFVYNMGGNAPQWAENDINILPLGSNIIDSLWEYLENNPDTD